MRDLVAHLPHAYYRQVRLPLISSRARYRVFWTFARPTRLRQVGDVTIEQLSLEKVARVVLSKRRRNDGPKHTKVLVTNLPQMTAHGTVAVYLRRWLVALFFKQWQGVVGVGQHQVTNDAGPGRAFGGGDADGLPGLAAVQARDIRPGQPWSAFALKHHFAWEVSARHFRRCAQQQARREAKWRLAA